MSDSVSTSLSELGTTVSDLSDAWAAWRAGAAKAHLAAVMGPYLARHCTLSEDWTVEDTVRSDASLNDEIVKAR